MPDFSNNTSYQGAIPNETAPYNPSIPTVLPGFENLASEVTSKENNFKTLESQMTQPAKSTSFIPGTIPYAEVEDNKRYGMYNPSVANMEDYAAHGQSPWKQLGNSLVKTGALTLGTFAQGMLSIPSTISAITSGDFTKLYDNPLEQKIDNLTKNIENSFPNYYTDWETAHPFASAIPFVHGGQGFANFWGDKVIKNLGFTAGAIGSAVVQDLGVGLVTQGLGDIPLVASQVGKASLWLNKLFTGTNDVAQVLKDAQLAGEGAEGLLNIKKLGELAAATKVSDGGRYMLNLWSSARTEGAIEARDGYNTVKADLVDQFRKDNNGFDPEGKDMDNIESYAKASANVRMAGNLALLSISNAVQFDNILKPFSAAKGLRSTIKQQLEEEGAQLVKGSVDKFETTPGIGNSIWRAVRKKLPEILSEGPLEEGGQYAIQTGTQKYYEDKYNFYKKPENKGKEYGTLYHLMESTGYGLGQEFGTNEGMENVLLGGLTAVITGGITSGIDRLKGTHNQNELRTLGLLNSQSLTGTLGNNYKDANNSLAALEDMQKAIDKDDIFEYKNLKHKEFFSFIQSAVKAGRFDVRLEQFKMLNDLSQEEFEKTFDIKDNPQNRKTVQAYVGKLISNAENIKNKYDTLSNVFSNPFRRGKLSDKPTANNILQAAKWDAFEDYKTQLAYLSSVADDTNQRISDIRAQISKASSHVNVNTLMSITPQEGPTPTKGLIEMRDHYLEQYKLNQESAETLVGIPKADQKKKAQGYKNMAEKINSALRTKSDEDIISMFDDVLHFSSNNDTEKSDKNTASYNNVSKEQIVPLYIYGVDANRLEKRKKDALKYYDALSTEKGFNKYFEGRDGQPLDSPEDIFPKAKTTEFDEGRTYTAKSHGFTSKKMPDGKWATLDRKGNIVNSFDTQKEARQNTTEMNSNRNVINVIQNNADGTVKIKLQNGDIVDVNKADLSKYIAVETPEEIEAREAKELAEKNKELKNSEDKSGLSTQPFTVSSFESMKKADHILFSSTITPSQEYSTTPLKPHHLKANYFASHTLPNMKNQDRVKAIVLNPKIEAKYGLPGLNALSGGDDETLIAVIVEQDEKNKQIYYFLDENGNHVGKLGEQTDPNLIVFQTMPLATLTNSRKETKYRNTSDPEEMEKLRQSYENRRKQFLSEDPKERVFDVSSSFGVLNKTTPKDTKNHVSTITNNTDSPIVKVSTTADQTISNSHQTIKAPLGQTYLVLDNTIQQLRNRHLTDTEQDIIYKAMDILASYAEAGNIKSQEAQALISSLKGLIYWGTPTNDAGNNSIWFDQKEGVYHFGKDGNTIPFTVNGVKSNKDKILTYLSGMYNNVHATYLNDNKFNAPFNELIGFNGTDPIIRTWKNYQTYLISDKYPDGSSRSIEETPLYTNIPPILPKGVTNLNAQTRSGAYFTLQQLQTELYVAKPKAQKKNVGKQATNKQGKASTGNAWLDKMNGITPVDIENEKGIQNFLLGLTNLQGINGWTGAKEYVSDVLGLDGTNLKEIKDAIKTINETKKGDEEPDETLESVEETQPIVNDWLAKMTGVKAASSKQSNSLLDDIAKIPDANIPTAFKGKPDKLLRYIQKEATGINDQTDKVGDNNYEKQVRLYGKDIVDRAINTLLAADKKRVINSLKQNAPQGLKDALGIKKSLKDQVSNIDDLSSAYDITLKYFAEGGKVGTEAIQKIFGNKKGKSIESERKARISLLKKDGDNIEQLAHKLWEADDRYDTSEYRDAIESVLIEYNSAAAMAKELLDKRDIDKNEQKYYESKEGDDKPPAPLGGMKLKVNRIKKGINPIKRDSDFRTHTPFAVAGEDWDTLTKWIETNLPGVPVFRTKNLLGTINNTYAWGAYSDGAIYIYENAEFGTYFHEAFHAIARNFLSPGEIDRLRDEFRNRQGSYTDYATGNTIKYSDASDAQIDEELAEEFRGYALKPTPATKSGISKFFQDLWNWVKSIFTKKDEIQALFKKINAGAYRGYTTGRNVQEINDIGWVQNTIEGEYRLAPGEKYDIEQHMTSVALDYLLARDENGKSKGLFTIGSINREQFYSTIKDVTYRTLIDNFIADAIEKVENGEITQEEFDKIVEDRDNLQQKLDENWDEIVKDHEISMKYYSIEFDDNDVLQDKNENNNGREGWQDAMKVDVVKKATLAVKLLTSTIKQVVVSGFNADDILQSTTPVQSSVGGDVLVETGKAFVSLLSNLSDKANFDSQIQALIELSKNDPNYIRLFSRIRGNRVTGKIDWNNLEGDDLKLLISFSKTFNKQQPEALLHYILEDGTAVLRAANTAKQADQLSTQWISNMVANAKTGKGYLEFKRDNNDKTGGYYSKGLKDIALNSPERRINFLKTLGIDVSMDDWRKLSNENKKKFTEQVSGIYTSLKSTNKILALNKQTLGISGRIDSLATMIAKVQNPEANSTFFNQDGELQQSFVEKNYVSHFIETINNVENKQDLRQTSFSYLLDDVYSTNSELMKKMFNENGSRTSFNLSIGYVTGTVNQAKGRNKSVERLTKGERILQEINANLSGYYHLLEPADSSTQWLWNIGNIMHLNEFQYKGETWKNVYNTFSKYLIDEINLARDNRSVDNSDKLRFFNGIIGNFLNEEIKSDKSPEDIYKDNKEDIDKAINEFITNKNENLKSNLFTYKILEYNKNNQVVFNNLNTTNTGITSSTMHTSTLNSLLTYLNVNYALAQMELFKTILGDPHQSKEWLKRAKSFFSPRETTVHSSPELNTAIDKQYNRVGNIILTPGEIGYMEVSDVMNTATLEDPLVATDLYPEEFKEPDGQGIIIDVANRQLRIKAATWNDAEESQYQYDKAWERNFKNQYDNEALKKQDDAILAKGNPKIATTYYPLKPVATGRKGNSANNEVVLDKYSLAVVSFRTMQQFAPDSNMMKLIAKMDEEKLGYVVFQSGRKIGSEYGNPIYNNDGTFNTTKYKSTIEIPYEILGIQVQTAPKTDANQTLGSQLTKLATMDLMAAGIPIDFTGDSWSSLLEDQKKKASPLYTEIKHNQEILEKLQTDGYNTLLKKLGVKDNNSYFEIEGEEGRKRLADTLDREILRRDSNDNMKLAMKYFRDNQLSLESTNMYQQFKNILYSMVDKNIVSPSVTGGPKVQIASTFFENERLSIGMDKNGGTIYGSTNLKEYKNEDGQRHIEVYISSAWLRKQLPKSMKDLSDEELYSKVDKSILFGIGFRIPNQALNSSDVFIIKKFLPIEMGDAVVVPSSMVKKSGSDFDIDKLNTYLKNVYVNAKGEINSVPFFGFDEKAKENIKKWLTANELTSLIAKGDKNAIENLSEDDDKKDLNEVDRIYTKSLQNEYYDSLRTLLSHPLNFDRLTHPNDASLLKDLAKEILALKKLPSADTSTPAQLLDREYVTNVRHNFLSGKTAVGIAAVSQTGHSLRERIEFTIDPSKLKGMDREMKEWLGDGSFIFGPALYNQRNGKASLSEIKTKNGKHYISDVISMFIDGAVDVAKGAWIVDVLGDIRKLPPALLMTELGFDPHTMIYFLNQPIIEDYLQRIDNSGYNWLFIDTFVKELKESDKYKTDRVTKKVASDSLKGNIGKSKFDKSEAADQQAILDQFLQFAKMANHLLQATQGTNWDTTDFTDPYIVYKKNKQLEIARKTVFSGVDDMLNASFIGNTRTLVNNSRDAIAPYIPTESIKIRAIIESVLEKYVDQPNRQFVKTARNIVNSFIDYAVSTHYRLSNHINRIMLVNNNIPKQLQEFVSNLPEDSDLRNNPFIQKLKYIFTQGTANLTLAGKLNTAYDQNSIINAIQEIKNNPLTKQFSSDIIALSLLQGIGNSPISFTQLLPAEDMKNVLSPIFDNLDSIPELENFSTLHAFERNNWNNADVVAQTYLYKRSKSGKNEGMLTAYSKVANSSTLANNLFGKNLVAIDSMSRVSDGDVITISYKKDDPSTGRPYTKEQTDEMRKKGDYSYITKLLMQKVYEAPGKPLTTTYTIDNWVKGKLIDSVTRTNIHFKAINAWGNSFFLQEYYTSPQQSQVENGYDKIPIEYSDQMISDIMRRRNLSQYEEFINPPEANDEIDNNPNFNIPNHAMSYSMPAAENLTGKNTSTLKLVEEGKRTATTRSYPLGKVGDIITFEGRPTQYKITSVEQLTKEKVNNKKWIQKWSEKEQWTTEYFKKVLGGNTVHVGSWQTSFEKVDSDNNKTQTNFQGYSGGYENIGKGTPEGDGKDKAMREVADGFIGEINPQKTEVSSTLTSYNHFSNIKLNITKLRVESGKSTMKPIAVNHNYGKIIMLARNSDFKGKDLSINTKESIKIANSNGASFVVGDMPGIDSQFIDYLKEINAKFTIYHTGNNSRIQSEDNSTDFPDKNLNISEGECN